MNEDHELHRHGQRISTVHVYGPADTDFSERYWDMTVTMVNGEYCSRPWIRAVHKESGQVAMINCAKCAVIRPVTSQDGDR